MYKSNEPVVYGSSGICRVEGTTMRDFGGTISEYYILKPLLNDKTTIYAPVVSANGISNLRSIVSQDEASKIIENAVNFNAEWNSNDIERKSGFRTALKNTDINLLAVVVKTILLHKSEISKQGKKLHSYDEEVLKNAEKLLYSELSFALNCGYDEIAERFKAKFC